MSYIDCPTPTSAAWWNTISIPSNARANAAPSVIDPRTNSALGLRWPGAWPPGPCTWGSRLSKTRTRCPWATSASTRCDPTNPAPPVTNTCSPTSFSLPPRWQTPLNNVALGLRCKGIPRLAHSQSHTHDQIDIESVAPEVAIQFVDG